MNITNVADFIGVGIAILIIPALFAFMHLERKWAREGKVLGYRSNALDSGINVFSAAQESEAMRQTGTVIPMHPGLPFIGGFLALVGFVLIFGTEQLHLGVGLAMIGAAFMYGYFLPAHLKKTQLATGVMLGLLVGGIVMGITDAVPGLANGGSWGGIAVFVVLLCAGLFTRKK